MCVEDASEYIWLRLEARRVLIGKSQIVKELWSSARSLIIFWNVFDLVISEDFDG